MLLLVGVVEVVTIKQRLMAVVVRAVFAQVQDFLSRRAQLIQLLLVAAALLYQPLSQETQVLIQYSVPLHLLAGVAEALVVAVAVMEGLAVVVVEILALEPLRVV